MLSLFFLCFFACDVIDSFTKSPAERLIDLRTKRTETMDALYTTYGGGTLTNEVKKETDEAIDKNTEKSGNKFLKALKNTVSEVDRSMFEKHCLTLGSGNHAEIITEKAKDFFEKPENLKTCKEIAVLDIKISELALKVSSGE